MMRREECDMSKLIVGTECGGSDPTSGPAANPTIGELSDRLVDLGATSILSETTEFIGADISSPAVVKMKSKRTDPRHRTSL